MLSQSSYRPHNPGNDYYAPGIYLITLVVRGREPLFGTFNMDADHPAVILTDLGKAVQEEWEKVPSFEATKGHKLRLHGQIVMPDHWHAVIEVQEEMDVHLGIVIRGFKTACTKRWWALKGCKPSMAFTPTSSGKMLSSMTRAQRAAFYASPEGQSLRPLFDDNYDDTICLSSLAPDGSRVYDQRHLSAMIAYVADNPRRAIIRKLCPDYMRRRHRVVIAGREYAAFGNLFLLRWARKVQVFCHRKAPDGRIPYEKTAEYYDRCREWKRQVMEGQTVMVTPGISMGERIIKDRCIESGYPLIHIQKEPIGQYWKPEKSRFEACEKGTLLILAPWHPENMGEVEGVPSTTDYSIFHNLNTLAEEICKKEVKELRS